MRSRKPLSLRTALVTAFAVLLAARADAQRVCLPVQPGDTAAVMALQLTGDSSSRFAPWFEIVDERWRLVPKQAYNVVRPGWLACIAQPRALQPVPAAQQRRTTDRDAERAEPLLLAMSPIADPGFLALVATLALALWIWRFVVRQRGRRRALAAALRRFGEAFVREFARPLVGFRGARPPPRARLRIRPRRARVEVLLAPADGGTYPNLSDHRRNVEYDVARVVAALSQQSFVGRRPYSEGGWVVLPFDYMGPTKFGGGR